MDLAEYACSEPRRTLIRLGITHLWPQAPGSVRAVAGDAVRVDGEAWATQPEEGLPSFLQVLFHGKHPPVATMWTYAGLEEDLVAATTPPRLLLFQKIQQAACVQGGWKEADICVWPLTVPPVLCAAGLDFFQPRLILSFGPLSRTAACVPPLCFCLPGVEVRNLPSLEPMLAGDQASKDAAWRALKALAALLDTA